MKKKVIQILTEHGTLVQPGAIKYIMSKKNPMVYVQSLINKSNEYPLILTVDDLKKLEENEQSKDILNSTTQVSTLNLQPKNVRLWSLQVKHEPETNLVETTPDVKIISDVSGNSACEGKVSDFAKYFINRYESIKKLLKNRREMVGIIPINRIRQTDAQIKIVGIVKETSITKKGHRLIEIEDETGVISALIPNNSPLISYPVVTDEVIGIVGKLSPKSGLINAENIVRPEISMRRETNRAKIPLCAAFVSDIHVGSKMFLGDAWGKFLEWLKTDEASNIKYIVIPGDAVDGIGVYPNQEDELLISDIFKQYEELARLLSEIPENIQIILSPGNHDAVRQAEPQPCFPENIRKLFGPNVLFVGNPCYFTLNGVEILLYHGRSMDDLVTTIPGMTYNIPIPMMKEMLRRRHLAPIYGGRTPIAPEHKDYLVIDRVPDIFVTGHVHSAGVEVYRNVTLINASAWQSQTSYQRTQGFVPDPGKVPVVNLQTMETKIMKFA